MPMKSPQGHRHRVLKSHMLWGPKHLRAGRHRTVSVPVIYAEDTRLVPGLELLGIDGLYSRRGFWD